MSMSAKTRIASSTSTGYVKRGTRKTQPISLALASDMMPEPPVLSSESGSLLDEAVADPASRLAWENDMRFQVSRQIVHLRRHRRMSQEELAEASGTVQSAIARIESGSENFTQTTAERLIRVLHGRLFVSIQPEEFPPINIAPWWQPAKADWNVRFVALNWDGETERAVIGMQRTTPPGQLVKSKTAA
jgi:transcriptional regulator with XRE-family HTH domain